MKREQVFVRAIDPLGKRHIADVLDLDDESFRAFVLGVLFDNGLVGVVDKRCEGAEVVLKTRVPAKEVEAQARRERKARGRRGYNLAMPGGGRRVKVIDNTEDGRGKRK